MGGRQPTEDLWKRLDMQHNSEIGKCSAVTRAWHELDNMFILKRSDILPKGFPLGLVGYFLYEAFFLSLFLDFINNSHFTTV